MGPRPIEIKDTEGWYERIDPAARKTARAVQRFVHRTAPELRETLFMGLPNFADYSKHINLGFYRGAMIRDAGGLL